MCYLAGLDETGVIRLGTGAWTGFWCASSNAFPSLVRTHTVVGRSRTMTSWRSMRPAVARWSRSPPRRSAGIDSPARSFSGITRNRSQWPRGAPPRCCGGNTCDRANHKLALLGARELEAIPREAGRRRVSVLWVAAGSVWRELVASRRTGHRWMSVFGYLPRHPSRPSPDGGSETLACSGEDAQWPVLGRDTDAMPAVR